jgi:hypothetical protein
MLREEDAAVGDDVELTSATGNRCRLDPELLRYLGGETRCPRVVPASGRAVDDLDRHAKTLVAGIVAQ